MLLNDAGVGPDKIMIHFNELTLVYMLLCPKMLIYASKKMKSILTQMIRNSVESKQI